MLATIINVVLVLVGSAVGLLFRNLISQRLMAILTHALGLCVLGIGVSNMLGTQNTLCVIVCMVVGAILGNAVDIERRLEGAGDLIRGRLLQKQGSSRFTEGFVNTALLFCVGAMAITGSIEAGLNHNYEIIISKGVIDGVTAISFAATMGIGVAFSTIPLLIYQGGITLLAGLVGPYLPEAVVTEMTAVGGTLIVAIAINMLELGKTRIQVGNLLPAMFLPIVYLPVAEWLGNLL
ncbi:MAG TPA: DUF554 domain-containing protein [Candidatus Enterenecus stercoripullorum]|nr:DUF554 domain-containing protein [Candidatus Enterenecus stercoripullorum]